MNLGKPISRTQVLCMYVTGRQSVQVAQVLFTLSDAAISGKVASQMLSIFLLLDGGMYTFKFCTVEFICQYSMEHGSPSSRSTIEEG